MEKIHLSADKHHRALSIPNGSSTSETKRGTEMVQFNAKIDLASDWHGSSEPILSA